MNTKKKIEWKTLPSGLLRQKCFKFDPNVLNNDKFNIECKICSIQIACTRTSNFTQVYKHASSEIHLKNKKKMKLINEYEVDDNQDLTSNNDYLTELNKQLVDIEAKVKKAQRECDLNKNSVEYLKKIQKISENEIESLKSKLLDASPKSSLASIKTDENSLSEKLELLEDENRQLKMKKQQLENEYLMFKDDQQKNNTQKNMLNKEHIELNEKIDKINNFLSPLKLLFDIKDNNLDLKQLFHLIMSKYRLMKMENILMKERLASNMPLEYPSHIQHQQQQQKPLLPRITHVSSFECDSSTKHNQHIEMENDVEFIVLDD